MDLQENASVGFHGNLVAIDFLWERPRIRRKCIITNCFIARCRHRVRVPGHIWRHLRLQCGQSHSQGPDDQHHSGKSAPSASIQSILIII